MKRLILLFSLFLVGFTSFAECIVRCRVKYFHKIYHEPATITTKTTGTSILVGTEYEENVWSESYTVDVTFYSGYEIGNPSYPSNPIFAIIKWDNGGTSTIKIDGWSTDLKYITEREIRFDSNDRPIMNMKGYDTQGKLWQIDFYR